MKKQKKKLSCMLILVQIKFTAGSVTSARGTENNTETAEITNAAEVMDHHHHLLLSSFTL
jgi:hypothetical protein